MLDLLFKKVSIVDGSGEPARIGDVGVKDGKITFATEDATQVVEGEGLTLCPGFIDAHSHGDMSIGAYHATLCKVCQGVTTEIGGMCGSSPYPVDKRFLDVMTPTSVYAQMPYSEFKDLNAYADYADAQNLSINMVSLVGHNALRLSVMGVADRPATADEMELMKSRLRECMEQGARGLSTGLVYIPGAYSSTDELVELCKAMKPYGGIYTTHMRNESEFVVDAVKESIYVAEHADVPLVISHHKIMGKAFWGLSSETLKLVREAENRGVRIMLDLYPYDACMTSLRVPIPPKYFSSGIPDLVEKLKTPEWRKKIASEMLDPKGGYNNFFLDSGGFGGMFVSECLAVPEAEGKTVLQYAEMLNKDPMETYFDLLVAGNCMGQCIYFSMNMPEVEKIYMDPHTVVGSDAICHAVVEKAHPRAWGTFIRPLTLFADEKKLLSFEQAIKKQTSQTADFWNLKTKGRIAEGYDADLVLIDRNKLKETATYADSNQKPEGIVGVYVNGLLAYDGSDITENRTGRIYRTRG